MENRDQRDFTGDSSLLYPLPSHYHHNHHHNPPASAALPFLNYLPRYSAAHPDFSSGFLSAVHLRHICSKATSDSAQVTGACHCSCSSNQTTSVWAEGSHRGAAALSLISRQLFLRGEWKQLGRTCPEHIQSGCAEHADSLWYSWIYFPAAQSDKSMILCSPTNKCKCSFSY